MAETQEELRQRIGDLAYEVTQNAATAVSYTHLTLPTKEDECRSRWSPYH